jgi:eukaryotic-like serine/threonine-protein kinase
MTVVSGSRLGPYEIASRLGAGGMGEVWRAKDTRLDRSVAIKILPAELAHHAQLRLRLEREAKTISQLNHPHICTLYDVGDDYLVMELLDGDTLADRIARGPLPMPDVLRIGHQIADALDRAHRAGIVHRDLKPGNVMLTKTGAKLLDFGLARSELRDAVDQDGPTVQVREALTEEGTILGTFQYMAPEQLEAQPADARTDLFALGCVLYEMATGRRAFQGKTRTSLIAAIVGGQPQSISTLQPVTPRAFEHVVQKCLEKDPDARWQSAHDVAEELRWIAKELEREETTTRPRTRPLHWSVAAVFTAIAIALGALWIRERGAAEEPVAFSMPAPANGSIQNAALSPDGRSIVMAYGLPGDDVLMVRRIGELEPVKIASAKAVWSPVWSPDGKWIAYFENERIVRIPASGGRPETVGTGVGYGQGLAWGDDNTILFAPRFGEGLFRVPASGGKPQRVTKLDPARRESLHGWPQFLPGGKEFLFIVHTIGENQNEIHLGTLDGKHSLVLHADSLVGYAQSSIVFVRDGAMYAQRFDASSRKLEGEPRRIVDGVSFYEESAHASASVAANGAITFFPIRMRTIRVAWHDRAGRMLAPAFDDVGISVVTLSRDGSKVAMVKFDPAKGANDVYTRDFARGVMTRVTTGRATHNTPVWSPSGDRVYFTSDRNGLYDIYSQVEDGTAAPQVVWQSAMDKVMSDVSPDGTMALADVYDDLTKGDLWLVPLAKNGGAPRPLIASEASEFHAIWSPDGKWIAYLSDRSGEEHLYVRRFPDGRSVQVSTEPVSAYAWNHDGSELLFQDQKRTLFASRLGTAGDLAQPAPPQRLVTFDESVRDWTPSRTDDRLLLRHASELADQVQVLSYVRKEW